MPEQKIKTLMKDAFIGLLIYLFAIVANGQMRSCRQRKELRERHGTDEVRIENNQPNSK